MIVQTQSYLKKEPVEGLNDETTKKSDLHTSELRNLKKRQNIIIFQLDSQMTITSVLKEMQILIIL